jgi:hypothetical protein
VGEPEPSVGALPADEEGGGEPSCPERPSSEASMGEAEGARLDLGAGAGVAAGGEAALSPKERN